MTLTDQFLDACAAERTKIKAAEANIARIQKDLEHQTKQRDEARQRLDKLLAGDAPAAKGE